MSEAIALAWSGGKDCSQALERLQADPSVHVTALLATLGEEPKRISLHGTRENVLEKQADALGLPLVKSWLPAQADNATYRERFAQGLAPLRRAGLDGVAFGDIALADVRAFREEQMAALGLGARFPLWGEATETLAHAFINGGYEATLCCVDAEQLDTRFLGRRFNATLLDDLPSGVDACGENGEFHTVVHGGPIFRYGIDLESGETHVSYGRFHFLDFKLRSAHRFSK